jgi:arsenate reductase (thioredoxin)
MSSDRKQSLIDLALTGASNLSAEFKGVFSEETIRRFLQESIASLRESQVTDYVPLFAYRFARERLTAAAQAAGSIPKTRPEVLFVCVHNAGRSQMAAALLDARGEGKIHVRSAGSAPSSSINKVVVDAMREVDLDLHEEYPKPMTDDVVRAADVVITMGCGDACPIYPGKRYEDWDVEDPAGKDLATVRRIRDDITNRVDRLISDLTTAKRQP